MNSESPFPGEAYGMSFANPTRVLDNSEHGPARIMVVDDEMAQMHALCDTLRDRDYETEGYVSAGLALATLRERHFDLLLTDLMMPEMNGITLMQAVRQIDPDLVVIIMTGEGSVASAVDAMKAGALDYILKPFKLSAVMPVLARALAVRELREKNATLQASIRERTLELETAFKELESFSYSVSHDLRAPLRIADSYLTMLEQDFSAELPTEARRLLQVAKHSIRHMGQLVEDLLRLARLSRQPLTSRPVDMDLLVREVLGELLTTTSEHKVKIKTGELPACSGDLNLLRQVYFNLLSNALKFTRDREQPHIEIGSKVDDGRSVYFVRDNGAGFDMRYAGKLFTAFQRLHGAHEFEGSGIGLSIVHKIVERHGGRIWAEGETNRGATFYFTLA